MSGRSKKKFLAPGSVVGRHNYLSTASPKRKHPSSNKRSAPSSPAHGSKNIDAGATGVASAASKDTADFADQPIRAKTLNYKAKEFVPAAAKQSSSNQSVRFASGGAQVHEMVDCSDDDESAWEDLKSGEDDSEDELEDDGANHIGDVDAAQLADGDKKPAAKASPSTSVSEKPSSDEEDDSEDEEEDAPLYEDLIPLAKKISFRMDPKKNFQWAVYDKLSVKEMRSLLRGRGQASSGTKNKLLVRLEGGDRRRVAYLEAAGTLGEVTAHKMIMKSLANRIPTAARRGTGTDRRPTRSRSLERTPQASYIQRNRAHSTSASTRVRKAASSASSGPMVEDASDDDVQEEMELDTDAVEMFPGSGPGRKPDVLPPETADALQAETAQAAQRSYIDGTTDIYSGNCNVSAEQRRLDSAADAASYAEAAAKTPPVNIATRSTASTAQSTVSSLQTPASTVASISGRLINSRPRRNVELEGVANFVSIVTPAVTDKNTDPSKSCHKGLEKAFAILKRNDHNLCFYPVWGNEPGTDEVQPITDPKKFPADLDTAQTWARITNPWDLKKVKPGEIDNKTGKSRFQKSIYLVVLVGSSFSLDHVLEISMPSLAAAGLSVRKKDVDALESATLAALVGIPNEWDPISSGTKLEQELAKHEEWMQANVTHGFTAREYSGMEFPHIIVRRTQVRTPEGKDILAPEENEVVQYAWSLRKLLCVEVSGADKARVSGVLLDFKMRGKLRTFSSDCDLLMLDIDNRADESKRLGWYKQLFAQMNYAHVHTTVEFGGIISCDYPARGELDTGDGIQVGAKAFKYTSIRRELLDLRRSDGKKVFLGAIDRSGDRQGYIQLYYFNDDANEAFVAGMHGNAASYLYAYLHHVKRYSARSISSILAGFDETHRLTARDVSWDSSTLSARPLQHAARADFAQKMAQRGMEFLLPSVIAAHKPHDKATEKSGEKKFSDAAKDRVADGYRFKNKPGYNPSPADAASVLSEHTHATTGAASNRSVTTQDIESHLPELRLEINRLKDQLLELSPNDDLFDSPFMTATDVDQLSLGSSQSATLASFYKDTKECIRLLKVRIGELGQNGSPPPASGSTGPSPSVGDGGRGAVQGG